MSSNRTKARSIATQLVLLFTLCAALLLSCSLGVLYWVVVRHAFEEDNVVLADKVDALENALQHGGLEALSSETRAFRGSLVGAQRAVPSWGPGQSPVLQACWRLE